jgi:TonB-linked SusC/RagA family outer membrane protein
MKKGILLKKCILLSLLLVSCCGFAFSQGLTVSGKITDKESGLPLEHVSVAIKGSNGGTSTNINGEFTLQVPDASAVLVFSYVGRIRQEITVGTKRQFSVSLEQETNSLDDVVVVGYGTQKRSHLTGSVGTVDMKTVQDVPVVTLSEALRGQIVGVNISGGFARPGEAATITIRNPLFYSKDGGSKDPLFVIDDIIRSKADFDLLDISEIESITVLKDAAAAIYGILGSNGAIVIRTKRGKSGPASISYSGSYGLSSSGLPKMMNAYQQAQYLNDYNAGSKNWDMVATAALPAYYTPDELDYFKTHSYDWLPQAWQKAYEMRQTINVSGGSDRATYFAGLGYNQNNSNFEGLGFKRYSFRSSTDIKLANGLKLGLSLSGDLSDKRNTFNKQGNESLDNDWKTLVTQSPFYPPYINGLPILIPNTNTNSNINNYHYFAVHSLDNYTASYNTVLNFQGQLSYEFPFLKGLKASMNFNKNIANSWGKQYGTKYNVYQFNTTGTHNHILADTYSSILSLSNGDRVRLSPSIAKSYQFNAALNYDHTFGKHQIGVLLAYEQSESFSDAVNAENDGVVVGGLDNQNFSTIGVIANEPISEAGRLAYIARVDYSYDSKYLLQLQLRGDASQNFAPENRWGQFPSVSAGWVISSEKFFDKLANKVNYLKLRASAAWLGLDATKPYQWLRSYAIQTGKAVVYGGNADRGLAVVSNVELANRAVHWDDVDKYDIGLDAKFLKSRLSATLDYYIDYRSNMLSALTSSPSILIGATLPSENFRKANNFGYEASVGWRDRIGNNWGYNITTNFSWFDNKQIIVDQPAGNVGTYLDIANQSDDLGFLGYRSLGIIRTQADVDAWLAKYPNYKILGQGLKPGMILFDDIRGPKDASGKFTAPDGTITSDDQDYLNKKANNHYGLGLNWGISYKSISLNVMMGMSWGGVNSVESAARKVGQTYFNRPEFWNDHWTPDNTNAKYPSPFYSFDYDLATDFWWRSSFSFRVDMFNLSYALPPNLVRKAGFNSARIYLVAENPLNLSNPYDYKSSLNGSYDVFPVLKTFTLGLNLNL